MDPSKKQTLESEMRAPGSYSYASASGPGAQTYTSQSVGDKTVSSSLYGSGMGSAQERISETGPSGTLIDESRTLSQGQMDRARVEGVDIKDVVSGGTGRTSGEQGFIQGSLLGEQQGSLVGSTADRLPQGNVSSATQQRVSDLERPGPGTSW